MPRIPFRVGLPVCAALGTQVGVSITSPAVDGESTYTFQDAALEIGDLLFIQLNNVTGTQPTRFVVSRAFVATKGVGSVVFRCTHETTGPSGNTVTFYYFAIRNKPPLNSGPVNSAPGLPICTSAGTFSFPGVGSVAADAETNIGNTVDSFVQVGDIVFAAIGTNADTSGRLVYRRANVNVAGQIQNFVKNVNDSSASNGGAITGGYVVFRGQAVI